jgi:hypothetical protein
MSRLPYPKGVTEIVNSIERMATIQARLEVIRVELALMNNLTKEYNHLEDEKAELSKSVVTKMEKMDVESPGNFGWERRFGWFLGEFYRQVSKKG